MKYSVAIFVLLLALAACSSSGHDPHVASLQSSSSGAGPTPSPSSDADRGVAFARCMRQHGVNIPDPGSGGDVQITGGSGGATKRALHACQHLMPNGKLDPNDPRNLDQMVRLARCLRRHGIDVADPTPAHPDLQLHGTQKTGHKFADAIKACDTVAKPGTR